MICFQIFYLCPTATTERTERRNITSLWFAFRFFIFVQRQQHFIVSRISSACCDLLSDFLSLSNGNNHNPHIDHRVLVVICFQIFYLCPTATTTFIIMVYYEVLWFAFRFFIFVQRQQPKLFKRELEPCCDLLSDFLSLSNGNNDKSLFRTYCFVVICFQIFYLCPTATTDNNGELYVIPLWFAFRFFIFVQRQQH